MRSRRTTRVLGAVVAVLLLPGLLLADSLVTGWTSPVRQTRIIEVSPGDPTASTHDAASATILLNGLGRDISAEQARAIAPALGRFGRVLALEYGAVFEADRAADRVHEAFAEADAPPPWHLTVVASSMGDVRGLELIASLEQRHPDVLVEGFVVNTGPGPHKRSRVKGDASQFVIDSGCTAFIPVG